MHIIKADHLDHLDHLDLLDHLDHSGRSNHSDNPDPTLSLITYLLCGHFSFIVYNDAECYQLDIVITIQIPLVGRCIISNTLLCQKGSISLDLFVRAPDGFSKVLKKILDLALH